MAPLTPDTPTLTYISILRLTLFFAFTTTPTLSICSLLYFTPLAPLEYLHCWCLFCLLKCLSVSLERVPSGQGFLWFSAFSLAPSLVSGVGRVSGEGLVRCSWDA